MLTGGRRKTALLGDAMEAVIAAVYLDAGFERRPRAHPARLGRRASARSAPTRRDPKTALQEWAQARGLPPPAYATRPRGPGPRAGLPVEARLDDGRAAAGRAASKRAAEQAAAEALLAAGPASEGPFRDIEAADRADLTPATCPDRRVPPTGATVTDAPETRCGFVALIGEPNAGKSTLLNRMVGAKVSIVTHKVQTTRARIRGIAIEGAAQLVFVDTPGLFRPRRRLDRAMVKAAWGGAADADVVVLLIEAHRGLTDGVRAILDGLADQLPAGTTVALAINKIDRVKAEALLALSAELNEAHPFAATFMISAERGHGVEDLRRWLAGAGPPRARGSTPRTRSPTCPSASSPPRSPARS